MKRLATVCVALICLGAAEPLGSVRYRAVTLDPAQRKFFRVVDLEKVTAASGRCVEEGMDVDETETFWLEATCGGIRTTLAWKRGGERIHVMACAEDDKRTPANVKLRQKLQNELKTYRAATACVRGDHVEMWGWALTPKELDAINAIAAKAGIGQSANHVELLTEDER